jgi:hypothetical protein
MIDCVNRSSLDSRVTFTRASTATFVNSSGVITTAAANVPRFTHDPSTLAAQGLLIEEQRTNLCLQSEDFSTTWAATQSSITTNAAVSPSGTSTADKLIEDIANAQHFVFQVVTGLVSGGTYTYSFFAKSAERTNVQILFAQGGNNALASANLTAGTISAVTVNGGAWTGGSATITNVGNGWYRLTLTATIVGSTALSCRVALEDTPGNATYTGDGTSGLFIWGAQLEAGAFPTSYIPTTTTALTRNADVASMTGTNFSDWYNASEGAFNFEFSAYAPSVADGFGRVFQVDDGTNNNSIQFLKNNGSSSQYFANVNVSNVSQATLFTPSLSANVFNKVAFCYKVNDFAQYTNGGTLATDSSGTLPVVNRLVFSNAGGTAQLNGTIRRIAFYPQRLANAQLQALTG